MSSSHWRAGRGNISCLQIIMEKPAVLAQKKKKGEEGRCRIYGRDRRETMCDRIEVTLLFSLMEGEKGRRALIGEKRLSPN